MSKTERRHCSLAAQVSIKQEPWIWLRNLHRAYLDMILPNRWLVRQFIRSVAGDLQLETCLDVGAGTCPFQRDLERAFTIRKYIPSDVVPKDRTMLLADARHLPIPDNSVDLLAGFDVVYCIPDYDVVLREAHRVLTPGGALLLTYTFLYGATGIHDYHRWTIAGMEQDLANAGFHVMAHKKRGGPLFTVMMMGANLLHNLAMGPARDSTDRSQTTILLRMGLASILVFPFQLLGWLALGVDHLLPSSGLYVGGMVLAQPISREAQVPG